MTPPHFCIFVIISPLKRTWPLICTILNSLYLRMICTNLNLHYIRKFPCKYELFWLSGFKCTFKFVQTMVPGGREGPQQGKPYFYVFTLKKIFFSRTSKPISIKLNFACVYVLNISEYDSGERCGPWASCYSLKHFSLHLVIYLFIHESFILSSNSVNLYVRNRRINNKCTTDCITEFMPSIHATCYQLKH